MHKTKLQHVPNFGTTTAPLLTNAACSVACNNFPCGSDQAFKLWLCVLSDFFAITGILINVNVASPAWAKNCNCKDPCIGGGIEACTSSQKIQLWVSCNFFSVSFSVVASPLQGWPCCKLQWISGQNDFKLVWFVFPLSYTYYHKIETKEKYKSNYSRTSANGHLP